MSSSSIRSRVKAGLAKAVVRTGSTSVDKVYLVSIENSGTALTIGESTESLTLLPNAIFTNYNIELSGSSRHTGDRLLISDSSVNISLGDTIRQGSTDYTAVGVSPVSPTSDNLLYKTQVRVK